MTDGAPPVALLDLDGTLVDSSYFHAVAWFRAFRAHDLTLPTWRIHRHVGMGGDQLVPALAGDDVEREQGESLRAAWSREWQPLRTEVQPLEGARELLVELRRRGHTVVLASSAQRDDLEHYVRLIDAAELVQASTTADDVDATKPHPDILEAALARVDASGAAVMVGDSPWDCRAATRIGLPSLGLLTGGFSAAELEEAGAAATFASLVDLREALDDTPFARRSGTPGRSAHPHAS